MKKFLQFFILSLFHIFVPSTLLSSTNTNNKNSRTIEGFTIERFIEKLNKCTTKGEASCLCIKAYHDAKSNDKNMILQLLKYFFEKFKFKHNSISYGINFKLLDDNLLKLLIKLGLSLDKPISKYFTNNPSIFPCYLLNMIVVQNASDKFGLFKKKSIIKLILQDDLNRINRGYPSILHCVIDYSPFSENVIFALDHGADPDKKDANGESPLIHAIQKKDKKTCLDMVQCLIDYKAKVNIEDFQVSFFSQCPLLNALHMKVDKKIIEILAKVTCPTLQCLQKVLPEYCQKDAIFYSYSSAIERGKVWHANLSKRPEATQKCLEEQNIDMPMSIIEFIFSSCLYVCSLCKNRYKL